MFFYFALHLPDGFLSLPVSLATWAVSIIFLAIAVQKLQKDDPDKLVPLLGVCGAFIFAAQMINFPIPGGSSGHLMGGTLAGVLLGPWAGSLVMAVVFTVQALFFQDGGLTVLGANILNMGLVGTFGGYYVYKILRLLLGRNRWRAMAIAAGVTSGLSVMMAAALTGLQLGLSGTVPLMTALGALLFWHIWIGLGEALITVLTLRYLWRVRPDLLYDPPRPLHLTTLL